MQNSDIGPLSLEVRKIISNVNSADYHITLEAIIHTDTLDYRVDTIESFEIMKDFNNNLTDYALFTGLIQAGDYVHDIHSKRDNLEISIKIKSQSIEYDHRYKLIINNNKNSLEGTMYGNSTRASLNSMEMVRLEGQCLDLLFEKMRLEHVEGVYRLINVHDLMITKFSTFMDRKHKNRDDSKNTLKTMKKDAGYKIDIASVINSTVYDHIEVPTGLKLSDLALYLQETHYGVYNGNIGFYVQDYFNVKTVFVYPLYDSNRFNDPKVKQKMIVYSVPDAKYEHVEHTYLIDGDILKIISGHSGVGHNNGTDDLVNNGNAITTTKADEVMMRNAVVTDSDVTVSSDLTLDGQKDTALKDGTENVIHLGADSNLYKFRSTINKNKTMTYQLQWNYCNPELLYPGMPVCYVYTDKDKIIKLNGILQSAFVMYSNGTNSVSALMNIAVIKPDLK